MNSKELVAAALEHPYPTLVDLAEAFAKECAVSNCGMSLHDFVTAPRAGSTPDLAKVIPDAYNRFYQQSETDEQADGLEAERKSFLKPARQAARAVRDLKLPLTLANALKAYYGEAPFTKDTVK
jgi:hypothetical protein